MSKAKVEMSEELYRLIAPDGTEGPVTSWDDVAVVKDRSGAIYYCDGDPDADTQTVCLVTEVDNGIECETDDVDFDEGDEDDSETDDEEDEEEVSELTS